MLVINFTPFKIIQTERLLLRAVTMDDVSDMYRMRTNEMAMKYIGKKLPESIAEITTLIEKIQLGIIENTAIAWAITLNEDDTFVGNISFHVIDKQHYRAEIGYMILPKFWNLGIASEAIKSVIDYGFSELNFHTIEAHINPENKQSRKVLLKAGFVKEGYFKENFYFNGKFFDTETLSLINPNSRNI